MNSSVKGLTKTDVAYRRLVFNGCNMRPFAILPIWRTVIYLDIEFLVGFLVVLS